MGSAFSPTDYDKILAQDVSLAGSFFSDSVYLFGMITGAIALDWTGNDGTTSTAVVQASIDNVKWNGMRGAEGTTIVTAASDVQIWEITIITPAYIRLSYQNGNATAGTATVRFIGRSRLTYA